MIESSRPEYMRKQQNSWSQQQNRPLSELIAANSQNKASREIIYQPTVALQNTVLLQSACPQLSAEG